VAWLLPFQAGVSPAKLLNLGSVALTAQVPCLCGAALRGVPMSLIVGFSDYGGASRCAIALIVGFSDYGGASRRANALIVGFSDYGGASWRANALIVGFSDYGGARGVPMLS